MKWYLVKLIFSIEFENQNNLLTNSSAQFDEQLRLVEDYSEHTALLKARKLGKSLESSFLNANKKLVHWKFIDVREIILIDQIQDGIEIYSNTIETADREEYIHTILQRSLYLSIKQPICS